MQEGVRIEISGRYDPEEPLADPPEEVKILGRSTRMSLRGEDLLNLALVVQVGSSIGLNLASSWLYDVFVTRRREAGDTRRPEITINNVSVIVTEKQDIEQALHDLWRRQADT